MTRLALVAALLLAAVAVGVHVTSASDGFAGPEVVERCYEPAGVTAPCEGWIPVSTWTALVDDPDAERWWLQVQGPDVEGSAEWRPVDETTFHELGIGDVWEENP